VAFNVEERVPGDHPMREIERLRDDVTELEGATKRSAPLHPEPTVRISV
jgi:hypothetical protein